MSRLPGGDLLPLAGSRYLLVEFHYRGIGPDPEELIHELVVDGWCPVIAHPERIRWLADDPGYASRPCSTWAPLAQVTAMSVTHQAGGYAFEAASRMLDAGMVHFVASDAHDTQNRPPGLSQAFRRVAETLGEPVARELFVTNPGAILDDRLLHESPDAGPFATTRSGLKSPVSSSQNPPNAQRTRVI